MTLRGLAWEETRLSPPLFSFFNLTKPTGLRDGRENVLHIFSFYREPFIVRISWLVEPAEPLQSAFVVRKVASKTGNPVAELLIRSGQPIFRTRLPHGTRTARYRPMGVGRNFEETNKVCI